MMQDLSKVGELRHSFDAVLVKITKFHSGEHMKIMENCEIINARPQQELSLAGPEHPGEPSHPQTVSFFPS